MFKSLKNGFVILQSRKADEATHLYSLIDQKQVICIYFERKILKALLEAAFWF